MLRHATRLCHSVAWAHGAGGQGMANLATNIVDFEGSDSSVILIRRSGIPRPIGDFPTSLTQAMLVGVMLVGQLSVYLWRVQLCRTPTRETVQTRNIEYIYIYIYIHTYTYIIICIHILICVYIYIYIYTHTHLYYSPRGLREDIRQRFRSLHPCNVSRVHSANSRISITSSHQN